MLDVSPGVRLVQILYYNVYYKGNVQKGCSISGVPLFKSVNVLSIKKEGENTVKRSDKDMTLGLKELNPHEEMETLNSCISIYFKGKSGSFPVKEEESFILSALDKYFQGNAK